MDRLDDSATAQPATLSHFNLSLSTRRTSHDVWGCFANLERIFADPNQLTPSRQIEQLCGAETTMAGNEYRVSVTDPDYRHNLQARCEQLAGMQSGLDVRRMDFRVRRAGPFGGETAELVLETLENHAFAARSSLLIVAHPSETGGPMHISLDCAELCRPNWLPDFEARERRKPAFDWQDIFEVFARSADATLTEKIQIETVEIGADAAQNRPADTGFLDLHPELQPLLTVNGQTGENKT